MPALNAHQRCEFVLLMLVDDVIGGKRHRHFVWMPGRLLIDAVNQVHGAPGVLTFKFWFHPDREELRAQITLLDLAQVDMTIRNRCVLAKVKIFIEEALRRVSMSVNDNRRLMNGKRSISFRCRCCFGDLFRRTSLWER